MLVRFISLYFRFRSLQKQAAVFDSRLNCFHIKNGVKASWAVCFSWLFLQPDWGKDVLSWLFLQPDWGKGVLSWLFLQPDWCKGVWSWLFLQPDWGKGVWSWLFLQPNWGKGVLSWLFLQPNWGKGVLSCFLQSLVFTSHNYGVRASQEVILEKQGMRFFCCLPLTLAVTSKLR